MKTKLILSNRALLQLKHLPPKLRLSFIMAMLSLSENPFAGTRIKPKRIKAKPWEKCKCGKALLIFMDENSKDVYFSPNCNKCLNSFWMTEKEFKAGRKQLEVKQKRLGTRN